MISPELLRRYPFFGGLADSQLKAVAMIADVITYQPSETLFDAGQRADALYLVTDGCVDLYHVVAEAVQPGFRREHYLSAVSPGEIVGMSALIEPYIYTSAARASAECQVIRIDAAGLRALSELDTALAYHLVREAARTAVQRLHETRVQLVAARA